jgi:hypothetical protein
MRVWLLSFLISCDFAAATGKTGAVDTGSSGSDDWGDGGSADDSGDGDGSDTGSIDNDGDGYTSGNGDCDDTDPSIHPGVVDDCDGTDSDCDLQIDEDAEVGDEYEPNDVVAHGLGTLEGDSVFEIVTFLHDSGDEDRFSFDFSDGLFDNFDLRVSLETAATEVFFQMTVENLDSGDISTGFIDETGMILYEESDTLLSTDGGDYQVTITSNGSATCLDTYTLRVELEVWF